MSHSYGSTRVEPDDAAQRTAELAMQLSMAVCASDWDVVGDVVSGSWPALVFGGQQELVRTVIAKVPQHMLMHVPALGFFAELSGRIAPGSLELPLPGGRRELLRLGRSSEAGAALRNSAIAIAARRSRGRHRDSLELARRGCVVAESAEWSPDPDVDQLLPLWFLQAGVAAQLGGDFKLARHLHRSAYRRRTRTHYDFVGGDAAGNQAMLDALEGDVVGAQRWIVRAADETFSDSWIAHLVHTSRNVARVLVAVDRLDLAAMRCGLDDLADTVDLDEHWPNVIWARTHAALLFGDPLMMLAEIQRGVIAHGHRMGDLGLARDVVAVSEADLALSAGRPHQAKAALERLDSQRPEVVVARARLALVTGEPRRTYDLVVAGIPMTQASPRVRVSALLLRAAALDSQDDLCGAAVALREALRLTMPQGILAAYATVSRDLLERYEPQVERLSDVLYALDNAQIGDVFPQTLSLVELTSREEVVLEQLTTGATIPAIAESLHVSPNTIKTQVASLYRKLDAGTREEAIGAARRVGLLP